tara:strand:+ start:6847 stop:7392 length:546 start_codon:yes stop_codon:yes gene_type:complete
MFAIFGKKKLSEDKLSNIAVNSILDTVDQGFPEIAEIIKNSPELITEIDINDSHRDVFLLIVIAANLQTLPHYLDSHHDSRVASKIIEKFALVFDVDESEFEKAINEYKSFLKKVNHPSNNTLYSVSKAVFHKFGLANLQEEYFKNMKVPNPLFLKRLDEVTPIFLFDWESITDKYQVVKG